MDKRYEIFHFSGHQVYPLIFMVHPQFMAAKHPQFTTPKSPSFVQDGVKHQFCYKCT